MIRYAARPETSLYEKPDDVDARPHDGLTKVNWC